MTNKVLRLDLNSTKKFFCICSLKLRTPLECIPDRYWIPMLFEPTFTFDTREQLDLFASTLGFTYTFNEVSGEGYTSIPIHDFCIDEDISNDTKGVAYGISEENLMAAKTFQSVANGRIGNNLFVNDGSRIKIYRCSPYNQEFFKSLSFPERLQFKATYGRC